MREHEDDFIPIVRQQSAVQNCETAKTYQKQIAKNERRIAELDKLIISIYEDKDKVKGLLSEARFVQMAATYEQEQTNLKQQTCCIAEQTGRFQIRQCERRQICGVSPAVHTIR